MLEITLLLIALIVWLYKPPLSPDLALDGPGFAERGADKPAWMDNLMFKKGKSKAPAPDPNIAIAAAKEAQTGAEWLAFAKVQFAAGEKRQDATDALERKVADAALADMEISSKNSRDQWERYKTQFMPVEDRVIKDANEWDSAARQEKMAGEAKADIMAGAQTARDTGLRQMAASGIDPRSGRHAGIDSANNLNTALAAAGSQNNARSQVRTQGAAMREGVANMGRGATSTAAQQLGLGLQAGNSAGANQQAADAGWRANQSIMNAGFGGQMAGYRGQGSALNTLYGNQLNGWSASQSADAAGAAGMMGGIGSLVGSGASLYAMGAFS